MNSFTSRPDDRLLSMRKIVARVFDLGIPRDRGFTKVEILLPDIHEFLVPNTDA